MKIWMGMLALMLLLCTACGALAAKADFIYTQEDSAYHAEHLLEHIGEYSLKCTGNYVKTYSQPTGNSQLVGHLEQADEFELCNVRGGWAQIRVEYADRTSPDSWDGMTGWMNADYLQCSCTADEYYGYGGTEARGDDLSRYIGTELLACATNNLRVRSTPGGRIVGHIERADRFRLLDIEDDWACIEVTYADESSPDSWAGLTGWVSLDYLSYAGNRGGSGSRAGWKKTYLNFVQNELKNIRNMRFALMYVNDDDIPELACTDGAEAFGCVVLTCSGSGVSRLTTSRTHFTYIERQNLLCNSDGHMDAYYDNVYAIRSGRWQEIAHGEYYGYTGEWDEEQERWVCQTYEWNGRTVDMDTYRDELNRVYSERRAREPVYQYDYNGICSYLKR